RLDLAARDLPEPARRAVARHVRARADRGGHQPQGDPDRAEGRLARSGRPTALVVGKDRKAELRQLVTDRSIGDAWLVTSGLAVGDHVIVEGLQRVRPGAEVNPVPAAPAPKQAGPAPTAPAPAPAAAAPKQAGQ